MAQITFTANDAVNEITVRLKGYQVSEQHVGGISAILLAITTAQMLICQKTRSFAIAGSLCDKETLTFTTGVASMPSDCVVAKILQIGTSKMTKMEFEDLLRWGERPPAAEYVYAFYGNEVRLAPHYATADLYYIKAPELLTTGASALQVAPVAFMATCLRATLTLLARWEGVSPDLFSVLGEEYKASISDLMDFINEPLAEALKETGRKQPRQ